MRDSINAHESAHSFAFIVDNCMYAALVYFGFSHLWPSAVRLPTERHRRAHSHAQTQGDVINSITHTSVDANEPKTNPFLLMVCLRFNKKAFLLLLFIMGQIRKGVRTTHYLSGWRTLQQPQLNKRTLFGLFSTISLSLCLVIPLCLSYSVSVSAASLR